MATDAAPAAAAAAPGPPTSAGSPGSIKLAEPRRRNRPALSCIQCRTRKIRCDRNEPCASCMKSKIVNCTYEEARRPKPRLWRLSPAPAGGHPERSPTATDERPAGSAFAFRDMALQPAPPASNPSSGAAPPGRTPEPLSAASPRSLPHTHQPDSTLGAAGASGSTAALAERVRQLEQQLADALRRPDYGSPSSRSGHTTLSQDHGTQYRRLSGASPLMNGDKLFPLIVNIAQRIESDKVAAPDIYFLLQQCRDVAKSIRSARIPTFATFHLGKAIPPQETALRLVDAYFRTFESVYRILHRPTFWQGYQKYWENPDYADSAFVVQFQLCMAIGTCFQDDAAALRRLAAQWIYEAQVWLALPPDRSRINFAGLQAMCLLHLARETCGIGGDLAWLSAGYILRTAMYLGLHRDPDNTPNMPVFAAEMRRRLWATVLELILQSSLDTGAPPLLALSDFDTRPPSNYDDEQLAENAKFPSIPRPPSCFTQTTVQIALLRSFPVRLAIAQYVNHFASPVTWEETIKWNNELRTAYGALSSIFQPFYDPAGILPKRLSLFQLRLAEHMVHRFFLALNHPWLWAAQNNPTYYFARKVCVEYSLKLYRAIATGSPAGDSGTASQSDDFTRLATCGYGAFRSVPTLAVLTICLELLWQVQEDRSFRQSISIDHQPDRTGPGNEIDVNSSVGMGIASGVVPLQELLEAVKYSIGWAERRIRCGEANVKGYLLFSALLCQAQALQRGASDAEVERQVCNYLTEELSHCLLLLKDAAGRETSMASTGEATNGGKAPLIESKGWGGAWESDDAMESCGFNSIFNIYDADFFLGT
ncbi:fungal-specific transcription factor domain-containing protein [Achaetomium macrosporum]|uniref:Fungal-specific transcription factor domain-containing protein n=1 Tax=Achaetomium macrosporum TaxID=79813 RepID=A0AAN7CB16_9PEZI|nr:fungal-specific transcription factor domain-containing protein [Achaetomium macrosporum]